MSFRFYLPLLAHCSLGVQHVGTEMSRYQPSPFFFWLIHLKYLCKTTTNNNEMTNGWWKRTRNGTHTHTQTTYNKSHEQRHKKELVTSNLCDYVCLLQRDLGRSADTSARYRCRRCCFVLLLVLMRLLRSPSMRIECSFSPLCRLMLSYTHSAEIKN